MVTEGNRLVDVGCDHGYLPVYLVQNHKVPKAIAMDVRTGPLSRAQEHIREYGLGEYIETRLSDGLAALAPGEGDTLVIAGMGGPLMERILTDGEKVRESFSEMVLAPQSDVPHFRHFIREQNWEIQEERMIQEDGKFYPLMRVRKSAAEEMPAYSLEEESFGKLLLEAKDPVLLQFLKRELRIRDGIQRQLESAPEGTARERLCEVKEERQLILAALTRYEGI
jgi:tRNA (adenine22-N1)-methyltransferase